MNPNIISWIALSGAIILEVIATTFLSRSEHVTKLMPSIAAAFFYGCSFYLLAQALRTLPLGVAYAIWGGLGVVLTAAISVVYLKQRLDWITVVGIGFIVVGVVIMNVFSKASGH